MAQSKAATPAPDRVELVALVLALTRFSPLVSSGAALDPIPFPVHIPAREDILISVYPLRRLYVGIGSLDHQGVA